MVPGWRTLACALVALLIALASPTAQARHAPPADFADQVRHASRLAIVIFHEHEVHGSYEASREDDCGSLERSASWQMMVRDTASGVLEANAEGELAGDIYVDRDLVGTTQAFSRDVETSCGYHVEHLSRLTCSYGVNVHGPHDRISTGAGATFVDDGRALLLRGPGLQGFIFRSGDGQCVREETGEEPLQGPSTPRLKLTTLVEGQTHERAFFEVKIPLERPESAHQNAIVFSVPSVSSLAGEYCPGMIGSTTQGERVEGSCTATSGARIKLVPDACGALANSYREHLGILREMPRIEAGAPEPYLRVWHDEAADRMRDVLADVRGFQLWGCGDELPEDPYHAIAEKALELRAALLRLHGEKGLSEEGKRQLLGVERQLQLLGVNDPTPLPADVYDASPPPGVMTFKIHSPVSLHVYAPDGSHVGWDDAAGAAEIGIEGATYVGAPMGQQTITLPTGAYKVEVEELGVGTYLLEVGANASGSTRNDSMMLASAPGRTSATHFAADRLDANGTIALDATLTTLRATGGAFRYVEPRSIPLHGAAAQREPAGEAEEDAVEQGGTGDPNEPPRDAPGLQVALVLGALVTVAAVRRARKGA